MPLCKLSIVGPVSELSTSLRVQGALPGANVLVTSVGRNPRDIAKGIASGGDDRIALLSGVTLQIDDILIAVQEFGGEKSDDLPKSLGLSVQGAPKTASELGHVGFLSHLYTCGEYLWITGAIPGTTVEVEFDGSTQGEVVSVEDGARLKLIKGLPVGDVSTWQSIPSGRGPSVSGLPDQIATRELPAPTIREPLVSCQTCVLVSKVYDGATVTLQRDSGYVDVAGFDRSGLWFKLSKPLTDGDPISVKQDLWKQCMQKGIFSFKVHVHPSSEAPAPVIIPPLCSGSPAVRVANLIPGAIVTIDVNGTKHLGMAPPDSAMYDFKVGPLPLGIVTATQEICSVSSPKSLPVSVDPREASIPGVKLLDPLYSCGRAVFVEGVHRGSILQVWRSDKLTGEKAPISDFVTVYDIDPLVPTSIPVTPYLREKQLIWVLQWACGDTPIESNKVEVLPHPKIEPIKVNEPVFSDLTSVVVDKAVSGSLIEVYLSTDGEAWTFAGSAFATPRPTTVPLNRKLGVGDKLRVSQSLCEIVTQRQATATVIRPIPSRPILDAPANGETAVDQKPLLKWHDPNAGHDSSADSYELEVRRGPTVIIPLGAVASTSFSFTTNLEYATSYTWQVRSKNTSGVSEFVVFSFTVKPAPPKPLPPPTSTRPVIESYDPTTFTLKGKQFLPSHVVWVRMSIVGTLYNSLGTAITDIRITIPWLNFTSDSYGNLSAVIDPKTAVPPVFVDGIPYYGCAPGEKLSFAAHDERPDPSDLVDHKLWSNTFTITC